MPDTRTVESPVRRGAAVAFWARAALRLPLVVYVGFYVAHGIEIGRRSTHYPDGAFFVSLYYGAADVDNLVWLTLGCLATPLGGQPAGLATWLVGYLAVTTGYAYAGLLLWRGRPVPAGRRPRAVRVCLAVGAGWAVLSLLVIVPGALDAVRTGENAPLPDYTGRAFIHAYEWMLLPWAVVLAAVAVAVAVLFRRATRSTIRGGGRTVAP